MEHVLNHTLATSEPNGQTDRRIRPQSAFVPRQSYFKHKGEDDDVGRPVLQHKPLDKGEFTQLSLAKVFEDDPGMRPKVFAPPSVNKVSYALMSHDIAGAVPVLKCAPNKPRDTDPNAPRYVLPGASSVSVEAAAAIGAPAAAVPTAAADVTPDVTTLTPRQHYHQYSTQQTQQHRNVRDTLNVSDINAVDSVMERPNKLETRSTQLNTRDVEGSWPGWEPPFRAHVGKNLRDPGLDVSDISGTYRRRRIFSARPTLGSNRGPAGAASTASREAPSQPRPPPPQAAAAATAGMQLPDQRQPCEASVSGERQQPQQPQSHLPPPLPCQPVQHETGSQQPWSSEGSSGGSSGATRRYSHPIRQLRQDSQQHPDEQPQKQEPVVHAAGAWPTTVILPLRPVISPPPFATHIPTGSVAAVLSTALDPTIASETAAVADHPAATVGKPTPGRRDVRARHNAKLTLADVQRADSAEAQRVIMSLRPSREALEEFFSSCRRLDREACGKVAPTDFLHALERANLLEAVAPGVPDIGVEPAAAAKALARGLQDGCGMVSYRNLARALLGQTLTQRSSSSKAPMPAMPVAPATSAAAATTQASAAAAAAEPATTTAVNLSPGSAAPVAAVSAVPAVAEAAEPRVPQTPLISASGAGAALRPTISRQTSDMQGDDNAKVGRPVHADGSDSGSGITATATSNDGGHGAKRSSDEPSWTVTAQGTMASRRSVNWAPEPPSQGADPVADNSQVAAPAMPRTPPNLQDQRRLELQEQQLRREGSARRRPYSAAPGGSKGAGAVAEVFKLLGAAQPILYNTPPPPAVHVPAQPAAVTTSAAQVPASSAAAGATRTPAASTPPQQDTLAVSAPPSSTPAAEPYDGMGFGPHWPPEPRPNNLQKRSTTTIMEGSNLQLRDVCDMTYFPYKAHALWFGGRVGPDGAEAPGGPAEAAREYQPSVDPLSFLVGKGHHRVHIPPSGHRLEPEVEAALVAKLRPKSALGGSPEGDARVKTASSLVNQLNVDNPLLYPGRVDPTTVAGEALKGMLGSLYSTAGAGSSTSASGNHAAAAAGAARPATASPRRSTHSRSASVSKSVSLPLNSRASGGVGPAGSIRVGRAALERQIHREELAAVRRLC
ncbi:hypothetical protein Vretimale_12253 [Volvox reticuliferus]|uniref:EF-hand domain-containing protein n=1 Tax=Volvox reticuliferus TaxID=1737510 RepID=A0A8J4FPZ8_9CHLO|nr:hypothetical protein Vretifemale_8964 [Volvox reticuliferus]GIM08275.1 hypothetical protein Vretimale_12253 [Volvox reticuliferus]